MSEKHDYDLGTLYHGDCLEVLRELPADSLDSVVSDPPAGIAFMGKGWDDPNAWQYPISKHGFTDGGDRVAAPAISTARNPNCRKCKRHKRGWKDIPGCECAEPDFDGLDKHLESRDIFVGWLTEVMRECLRVLKPGGHALVWSIPRTSHWTATALEEAGFEVRDGITHFKDRSLEVQKFLATLTPEQRELLERAAPTDNVLGHCFGQGFPKSLNISKTLDKIARGAPQGGPDPLKSGKGEIPDRTTLKMGGGTGKAVTGLTSEYDSTYTPATPEAAQWEGWGTSLKPAVEIWWLVRKPLRERTVAEQALKTGTGGINVGGSRVGYQSETDQAGAIPQGKAMGKSGALAGGVQNDNPPKEFKMDNTKGRWPANVVLSHSPECKKLGTKKIPGNRTDTRPEGDGGREDKESWRFRPTEATKRGYSDDSGEETIEDWECAPGCPVGALNEQSGASRSAVRIGGEGEPLDPDQNWRFKRAEGGYSDTGGASRFFHNFEPEYDVPFFYTGKITSGERKQDLEEEGLINKHPTVKSVKLMTFLVKLITPPGGTVLDPFAGSGSTLVAAVNNGFRFIGIERDDEYIKIAKGRLDKAVEREVISQEQSDLFDDLMGG